MADYLKDQLLQRGMPLMPSHARSVPTGTIGTPTGGRMPIREQGDYMGKLLDFIGNPLESADAGPAGVAPAVTQFITKGFINKPLRERATQDFIERIAQFANPQDMPKIREFATKYPRTVAHQLPMSDPSMNPHFAGETVWKDPRQIEGADYGKFQTPVKYNPKATYFPSTRPVPLPETVAHETAHIAQGLGNDNAQMMYNLANRISGYANNPFEASARAIAGRKMMGNAGNPAQPVNKAIDMMIMHPIEAMGLNMEAVPSFEGVSEGLGAAQALSILRDARKSGLSLTPNELADLIYKAEQQGNFLSGPGSHELEQLLAARSKVGSK